MGDTVQLLVQRNPDIDVPVETLHLGCAKEFPLPLQSQPLQALPGRVDFVLLRLDQFLSRVQLLRRGREERPWQETAFATAGPGFLGRRSATGELGPRRWEPGCR